jgi:hypothetical protein
MNDKNKLISEKNYGDNNIVAKMLGTTPGNVRQLLRRPSAKRHNQAVQALNKVIQARQDLLTQE